MKQHRLFVVSILALSLMLALTQAGFAQGPRVERDLAPDQGDDEELNEQLWEYFKKTPYSAALRYVQSAQQAARATRTQEVVLPSGWKISPAGTQVDVGQLPFEAISYGGYIVVLNNGGQTGFDPQAVSVVDPETGQILKTICLLAMFPSAVEGKDGNLYISGGGSLMVSSYDHVLIHLKDYKIPGYPTGIASIDATHLAVACMAGYSPFDGSKLDNKLLLLNTAGNDGKGAVEKETSLGQYPYALQYLNGKLYVTLLGENRLAIYDAQLNHIKTLAVGQTPQATCHDNTHLYVVNTGSDDLSVINTRDDSLTTTIPLHTHDTRYGTAPTSCTVEGNQIYVTQATINAVSIYDKQSGKLQGRIPTGWYPTKVLFDKKRLFVVSAKGIRARRPNINGPQPVKGKDPALSYVLNLLKGTLAMIPRESIAPRLAAWTREVDAGSPIYSPRSGFKLPIRHIFYIIRENRSYDQVMGDLGRGNVDPYLTLFGREITPNGHQVADQFVTLDDYYADGEVSVFGHSFTTSGYASPFLELIGNIWYTGRYGGYIFGMVPSVTSPAYLWDALDDKGVDYRIYGENYFLYTRAYQLIVEAYGEESALAKKFFTQMVALAKITDRGNAFYQFASPYYGQANTPEAAYQLLGNKDFASSLSQFLTGDQSFYVALQENAALRRKFAEYLYRYPFNYRSWDLNYSDLDRALAWKGDFEQQLKSGKVAQLHYIWLPNDHTGGTSTNYLKPDQLVAQNDAALGRIIETISHSPVWKESLILITEDDAQNGPDHVDATRTVSLAAGPYVKRQSLIQDRYDQLSLLRTIELLLDLKPMNLNDTLAVPMFSIFSAQPDNRPYTPPAPSKQLVEADLKLYRMFGNPKTP